ncbi:hypothetical protein CEXT_250441 [Caerostris extrusa]|uniref:Uncharacterized protein n=1 Tax=Caerostris extrusa TaxID=172846 RepID=A0AAV4PWI3_CAEEX|nr:hypothetical protein CEXT_250441 [Caerostris extrusa]
MNKETLTQDKTSRRDGYKGFVCVDGAGGEDVEGQTPFETLSTRGLKRESGVIRNFRLFPDAEEIGLRHDSLLDADMFGEVQYPSSFFFALCLPAGDQKMSPFMLE